MNLSSWRNVYRPLPGDDPLTALDGCLIETISETVDLIPGHAWTLVGTLRHAVLLPGLHYDHPQFVGIVITGNAYDLKNPPEPVAYGFRKNCQKTVRKSAKDLDLICD